MSEELREAVDALARLRGLLTAQIEEYLLATEETSVNEHTHCTEGNGCEGWNEDCENCEDCKVCHP